MDHKDVLKQLICKGLNREQAMMAMAILVEEVQIADRQGYNRGYNDGWAACEETEKQNHDLG